MIIGNKNITKKEFEKIILPFSENLDKYLINYVIPDVVAFYLANAHSRNCLTDCPLINHINSASDIFNVYCEKEKLIPQIEEILKIKYNLKIVDDNPLKITKYM